MQPVRLVATSRLVNWIQVKAEVTSEPKAEIVGETMHFRPNEASMESGFILLSATCYESDHHR